MALGHVIKPRDEFDDIVFNLVKKILIEAQYMGVTGPLMFPWSMAGGDWYLYNNVKKDNENFDINHYLEEEKIGYSFLSPKRIERVTPEDAKNYAQVFRAQRE